MSNLTIDADRLWSSLMETARFGGTPDGGIRRLTLTEEDRQVRDWLRAQCEALGCTVTVDALGNMFATRPGGDPDALPIAMGSHLDTQPTGGKFDGVLGVLAGLEVLRTLDAAGYVTRRPLMLVNWTNEEGSRFSPAMICSGAYAGAFAVEDVLKRPDAQGIRFGAALEGIGYAGTAPVGSVKFAEMFELHIEQGPVLEHEETTIGIVTGVQGMRWYDLVVEGVAAHAGTTPMKLRRDALATAAELVLAFRRIGLAHGGVATVGEIGVVHASRNVVPGEVHLTLDLRHPEAAALEAMERAVEAELARPDLAGTPVRLTRTWDSPPVVFDAGCVAAVAAGAAAAGYSAREIVSGAGHDSVYAARVVPTSMIFVPCKDGLSHNPAESATPADCAAGAQTLLNAVLARADRTDPE
ncbi:N-carbamoyl-L-amino-acid hydrolase [Ancylobacter sp. 3268]|uniref:Zn-dependent hydrolase n=1 Tax=Ancylobacter sp. 3268 TaxID=2817752 RepID=UPI00285F0EE5|nr:Zn-dependent hydrolase [Ancylobacter sp. 3268]MDR6955350.1 N-carbamoyl-L-amino-acid hydrolase [Ancylobacter sp. 3268]